MNFSRLLQSFVEENRFDFNAHLLLEMDALYRTAYYMLRDASLAEDIVQDVALKAIRGQNQFNQDSNFRPWVFSILRHTIIDYYRKQNISPPIISWEENENQILEEASLEGDFFEKVMDDEINLALNELPDEMRLAILLADVEGFAYEEIAKILNWPMGSVMSRVYRGRKKLRVILRAYAERKGYSL